MGHWGSVRLDIGLGHGPSAVLALRGDFIFQPRCYWPSAVLDLHGVYFYFYFYNFQFCR